MSEPRQPSVPVHLPYRSPSQDEFDWDEFKRLRENE